MRLAETRILPLLLLALACGWTAAAAQSADETAQPAPREVGLTERAERRLVQIDVSVAGPREALAGLTRADFTLVVGGKPIDEFVVDDLCEPPPESVDEENPAPAPSRSPVTYLFYFDHGQLTMAGRQAALDTARLLIPRLVRDGSRAMIVSSGKQLVTFAELTTDTRLLLQAIDRIEKDRDQFDPFPAGEDQRYEQLFEELRRGADAAATLAKRFIQDERWQQMKSVRLFGAVLGRLSEIGPPKAAIYFADTLRANAGEHYLTLVPSRRLDMEALATSAHSFDQLIEIATAHGIRLYTVQAQGMTAPSIRVSDAQNALVTLANETGGEDFLNGVSGKKIATTIDHDLGCLYLLSFDGADFAEDQLLAVRVGMRHPDVTLRSQGQLLLQSAAKRKTAQLFAAFATASTDTRQALEVVVIPTGYADGEYSALVQISVDGFPLANSTWDLGASLISRGKVRQDTAGRVEVDRPGIPIIYESQLRFKPGPYELIAVAHETRSDTTTSRRYEGSWPDPDDAPASLVPFTVLQPQPGAFLREGQFRRRGTRGLAPQRAVQTDLPTALIGLACRGRARQNGVRLERRLVGAAAVDFPALDLEFGEDRCVVIEDRIPAGTMRAGAFEYEVRALREQDELASTSVTFPAQDPPQRPASAPAGAN